MINRAIDAFLDTFFRDTNKALLVTGARKINIQYMRGML